MKIKKDNVNRIILLGGGKLLADIVDWAISMNIPVSVLTSPRHANEKVGGTRLSAFLKDKGVKFLIVKNIESNEAINFIGETSSAFCLSLGAAWIFRKNMLCKVFKGALFNLHGTRLPQNKGGGGFSWQIMMGTRFGYCQLHLVDENIDTGDIILSEEFLYPPSCRLPEDYIKEYSRHNLSFIKKFINHILFKGIELETKPQAQHFASYWPRLNTKKHGWINWRNSLSSVERFICAFDSPYQGAQTILNGSTVHLKSASIDFSDGSFHPFQNAIIFRVSKNWICVALNEGTLVIENLTDDKGNSIINEINEGDRFTTPHQYCDDAMSRVIYTPEGLKTCLTEL